MAGILFFAAALCTAASPLWLLSAVLIHEGGHLFAARLFHWQTPKVRLGPAGAALRYPGLYPFSEEMWVCLAGPAANLVTVGVCGILLRIAPGAQPCRALLFYSLGLAAVNLLPVSGTDGGGIFAALCAGLCLPDRAYRLCRAASVLSVLFLWAISLYVQLKIGFHLSLLAVSLYLTVTVLPDAA